MSDMTERQEELEETEVAVDEKLNRFIQLLAALNQQTVEILKTGNVQLLYAMNETIEGMYAIQHENPAEEYTIIEEECQVIYKNFNAIITMLNSNEKDALDEVTSEAVRTFLHNIFEANVCIVRIYGLA